jgi:hypothetical protein
MTTTLDNQPWTWALTDAKRGVSYEVCTDGASWERRFGKLRRCKLQLTHAKTGDQVVFRLTERGTIIDERDRKPLRRPALTAELTRLLGTTQRADEALTAADNWLRAA